MEWGENQDLQDAQEVTEEIHTPMEWEEDEEVCEVVTEVVQQDKSATDLSELAKKYDGYNIKALVHSTAKRKPTVETLPAVKSTLEQRIVSLPDLLSIKTIYDCALCGSLLSEHHYYSRDFDSRCGRLQQKASPIIDLLSGQDENNNLEEEYSQQQVIRPLYEVPGGEYLHKDIVDASTEPQTISTIFPDEENPEIVDDNLSLYSEEEISLSGFEPYIAGLNRIPPLYSNSNRRRRNVFNPISVPGALPHKSKRGIYYRLVNYDNFMPDLMSMTITNPTSVGSFTRNPNRYRGRNFNSGRWRNYRRSWGFGRRR